MDTPPPPTSDQYFLKTAPYKPTSTSPAASNAPHLHPSLTTSSSLTPSMSSLYLRLHGDGVLSVVLTPAQPKFLRWTHSKAAQEIAVPWSKPERSYGLVIRPPREKYLWEEVEIVQDGGGEGFEWVKEEGEDGREVLIWMGEGEEVAETKMERKGPEKGWMACDWVHGHPQLFYVTGMVEKELPAFCERVVIVREWLIPREK